MPAKIKNPPKGRKRQYKHKPKGVPAHHFEQVHWPYLPVVLVLVFLLTFGFQSGSLQAALHKRPTKVLNYATSMSVSGLLSATNSARASNGAGSLSLNSKLNVAAQNKAQDMSSRNYWSHYTPEGNPPWIFVTAQGYAYQKLGENLATGFDSEQATINGWMASPPHRENMLDSAFSEVGFGFANNANYTAAGGGPMTIIVAFYGQPQGAPAGQAASPAPTTPPPAAPKATPPAPVANTTPPPAPPTQPEASPPEPSSTPEPTPQVVQKPANTEQLKKGVTLSYKASNAQVAFAQFPVASFATGLSVFGAVATAGLWLGRHLLAFRHAWTLAESWVIAHPLLDVGLAAISILCLLFSQTAGIIQ